MAVLRLEVLWFRRLRRFSCGKGPAVTCSTAAVLRAFFGHVGHDGEEVFQVFVWVEPVFFGGLYDRVDNGAGSGSFRRVAEEPVFAADDERLDASFRSVIGDCVSVKYFVPVQMDIPINRSHFSDGGGTRFRRRQAPP